MNDGALPDLGQLELAKKHLLASKAPGMDAAVAQINAQIARHTKPDLGKAQNTLKAALSHLQNMQK
eukprot:9053279-Alexandrium_andersonii.AAC.1